MKSYLTEFVGTFFLVLTIGLAVSSGTQLAPLAIGASLMVMVYMGGHISGAHYNPAVSFAVMLLGRISPGTFAAYVGAQIFGALAAGFAVHVITGNTFAPAPGPGIGAFPALLVEVLYTFVLALVVLNTAVSSQTKGNSFYGLAIGFTIVVGAAAGGPISGGAFNPAVGIGPSLMDAMLRGGTLAHVWLYIVGPTVGAALAMGLFRVQEPAA